MTLESLGAHLWVLQPIGNGKHVVRKHGCWRHPLFCDDEDFKLRAFQGTVNPFRVRVGDQGVTGPADQSPDLIRLARQDGRPDIWLMAPRKESRRQPFSIPVRFCYAMNQFIPWVAPKPVLIRTELFLPLFWWKHFHILENRTIITLWAGSREHVSSDDV